MSSTVLFQIIQFSISTQFKHTVKFKNNQYETIQFSVITQFSYIWPIDGTLSGASTPGQSGTGSDGKKSN